MWANANIGGLLFRKTPSEQGNRLGALNANGKQFVKDVFGGDKGLMIIREAFIKAVIHRDYRDYQSFTKVVFRDDRIEIFNPVRKTIKPFRELKEGFEALEIPSHPTNPKLMRYFQTINVCERNGSGMRSLKASRRITMELGEDYVLRTTILFKPME